MSRESAFINSLRALAQHPAARDLYDDAAVLEIGNLTFVLTHDMLVEGVHFLPNQRREDVAWKLVAASLSDLAAKGAQPLGVLLGYMLGEDDEGFSAGMFDVLEHYGVPLLGGDTVSGGPPQAFGLTAIGVATHSPVPSRGGARAGEGLWLTGALGAAMIGYEALRDGTGADSAAYRRPMARLPEGLALAPHVTAMMDVSDGLLLDAWRLAKASEVSLAIDSAKVPLAAPEERRADALRWGDDYELLFTLPNAIQPPVPATRIGSVELQRSAPLFLDGKPIANREGLGWEH